MLVGHLLELLNEVRDLALTVAPQVHLVRGLHEKQGTKGARWTRSQVSRRFPAVAPKKTITMVGHNLLKPQEVS